MLLSKIKDYLHHINNDQALLVRSISFIAVLFISITLISLISFFYDQQNTLPVSYKKQMTTYSPSTWRDLPAKHLFGAADVSNVTTVTNLPLTLLGVMLDSNGSSSIAIISKDNEEEKSYHVNDQLPGNAELYKIFSDSVIIKRDGKYERLPLLKPEKQPNASPPANANTATTGSGSKPLVTELQKWRKNFGDEE